MTDNLGFIEDNDLGFVVEQPQNKTFGDAIKEQINNLPLVQAGKGFAQGISSLGVGLGKQFANPMRQALGKEPLSNAELDKRYGFLDDKPTSAIGHVAKFAGETLPYMALPEAKVLQGTGIGAKIGNNALTGAYQGATIGGLESLKDKGDLSGIVGGGIGGGIIGAALPATSHITRKVIENPNFQNSTTKTLETLTSVPQKYSNLALENELAGNTLFKGKFDVDTAYQPIEKQLTKAKNMLPSSQKFAQEFYKLGEKATSGMNILKENAGNEIIDILQKLNNKEVKNKGIQNAVNGVINSFGEGGVYNSAKRNAPRVMSLVNDELSKKGLTLRDLHRIKEDLYDIGYQAAGAKEGTQAAAARGTAEQINNYLRGVAPEYAAPNDRYSLVMDLERGLEGENTIAKKLHNIGSTGNIESGLDQRLKNLDTFLPNQNKFYKDAQNLIKSEEEINNIRNTIGKQYERNPRLLSNRNDINFENALEDLQSTTGVKFMPELEKVRAREALEKFMPGQGGGSGSEQGFMNNVVRPVLQAAPKGVSAAVLGNIAGGPIGAALGLAMVSPKLMAKGTIKNLGKLYQATGREIPESVRRLLIPTLYGGANSLSD